LTDACCPGRNATEVNTLGEGQRIDVVDMGVVEELAAVVAGVTQSLAYVELALRDLLEQHPRPPGVPAPTRLVPLEPRRERLHARRVQPPE
jgi:hypothetical protein